MRAALAILAGLWLAHSQPVRAADTTAVAWSAELGAETGKLVLVWPEPVRTALALTGDVARLRSSLPLPAPPPAITAQLSRWLLYAATLDDETTLAMRLRPRTTARLSQLHPRLAVIEFGGTLAAKTPATAVALSAATAMAEPMAIEPAAGPLRPIPIPRSRPPLPLEAPAMVANVAVLQPLDDATTERSTKAPSGVKVSAAAAPDKLELRFRWGHPIPAAMFERGGQLWVVFPDGDASVAGWRSLDRPEVTAWLEPVSTTGAGDARMFRFRLPRPVRVDPRATASGWSIMVTPAGGEPHSGATGVQLQRVQSPGALTVETEGEVVQLRNPDTGERLGVALTPADGPRQVETARLVDLELLPSLQGLVWRPLADGVRATIAAGRLTITRPGGLRLSVAGTPSASARSAVESGYPTEHGNEHSPLGDPSRKFEGDPGQSARQMQAPAPATPATARPEGTLGLSGLAGIDAVGRQQQRLRVIGDLRTLAGLPRAKARLELARLYLADALGPEARTALELIDDAELARPTAGPLRTSKLALTGAAEALAGRHDPALASLLDRALDDDAEIALWRAYAAAQAARWPLATQEWGRSGGLPEDYPDPLRRRLGLELAAAMLDHGDAAEARALLTQLDGINLSGAEGARLRLLEGIALARDGKPVEAEAAFAAAMAQGDGDIATRASFLMTSTRLERGLLTPEAAVDAMNADRPRWRGHPWEMRMLTKLAELQAAAGRPAAAITTRADAIARTTDPDAAGAARLELQQYLVAQLGDDTLAPLRRLALYRTHGDLIDGDATAPRLRADLAKVAAKAGLTETAGTLLDAAGPAPAGATLALVSALAEQGEVEGGLRRLGDAGSDESPAIADLRAELRARAALAMGNPAQAAAAYATSSMSSAALDREIAWRQADWQDLAQSSGAELAAAGDSGVLSPSQTDAVIWLGLAQSKLGRTEAAAALAARYVPRIEGDEAAALLRLATVPGPVDAASAAPAAAAHFATAVRTDLNLLPALAAAAAPVRTASVRSAPRG